MPRLESMNAVVTGASSGIGRAIALAFAREGADVIVNYRRSQERAAEVVDEIRSLGRTAHAIGADLAQAGAAKQLVADAEQAFDRIDVWVNNAGADILVGEAAELDDAQKLEKLIAVDLLGTIHCCWSIAPRMRTWGGGSIINMSWDLATVGLAGRNPQMFAAVKAGVLGFSKALARDCAPEVRVNVLAPGWIRTGFAATAMPPAYYREQQAAVPLNRFGTPEDVAGAALYLASPESSYVTGQVMNVNGGLV